MDENQEKQAPEQELTGKARSLANLRPPWAPGHKPAYTGGRPPKRPQSEANEEGLRALFPEHLRIQLAPMGLHKGATWAQAISLKLRMQAMQGNVFAAKELRESVEGKATQRFELGSAVDRGYEVVVTYGPGAETREEIDERIANANALQIESPELDLPSVRIAPETREVLRKVELPSTAKQQA